MKLRQISFKLVSLVMVITMLFSICATTISAATWTHDDHTHKTEKDKIYYVSLGDSMTNGYGLPGYGDIRDEWANSGVEDYGYGSYANIFAEWLATEMGWDGDKETLSNYVDHSQLAMSGIRIEDLHFLLEFDYNNPEHVAVVEGDWNEKLWNETFTIGDYWTWDQVLNHSRTDYTTFAILETGYNAYPDGYDPADPYNGDVALIAKYFQEHVKEADIISLGVGNGNFGVFAIGRILEAIGFDGGTPEMALIYKVENAIRELDPVMHAKVLSLKDEIEAEMLAILGESGDVTGENAEALVNTMVYVGISFVLNYMGTVDAIVELNPDAEIICLALMNTFGESDFNKFFEGDVNSSAILDKATIADVLNACYVPLNAFISGYATYLQLKDQVVKGTFLEIEGALQAEIAKIHAEADKQAAALKAEAEAKLAVLTEQLKTATGEAKVVIEAKIAEIKADLDAAIEEITNAADFDSQVVIDKIETELAVALAGVNANPVEEIADEIGSYIAALKARAQAKVAELTAAADAEIAKLQAALLSATGDTKAQLEAQIAEILADLDAAIAEVIAENKVEIAEAEAALAAAIEQVKANVNAKYESAKAEIEGAIAALKAELVNAADDAKAAIEAQIAALEAALEAAKAEAEAEIAAAVEALKAEAEAQIAALKAQAQAQIDTLKAEVETKIAIIKAEIEFVTAEAKAKLAAIKAEVEAKYAALKAQAEAQLATLKAQLETATGEVKAQIEKQIARVEAEYKAAVEALNAKYNEVLEQLHEAEAQFKAAVYAEIERIDAELEAAVAAINAKVTEAVEKANTVANEQLDAATEYVLEQIDAVNEKLNSQIAKIYTKVTETIDTLNEEANAKIAEIKEKVFSELNVSDKEFSNKFYFAEADYVECWVEVYGDAILDETSVIRRRMVEGVVETVWPLISDMFNDLLAANNLPLQIVNVDINKVKEYERFAIEWAKYETDADLTVALPTTTLSDNEIISCAVYLAFEDAIVNSANNEVALGDVLGLGGDLGGLFTGVAGALTPDALGFEDVYNSVLAEIANRHGTDIYNKCLAWASSEAGQAKIGEWVYSEAGQAFKNAYIEQAGSAPDAQTIAGYYLTETSEGKAKQAEFSAPYQPQYAARYLAPNLTTPLAEAVKGDASLSGLIGLFGRCLIAHGIGAHPSANGHVALAKAVIDAYEKGYTTFDKTIKDAAVVLVGYALLNGYVAEANVSLDKLLAEIEKLQAQVNDFLANDVENPAEFEALLADLNTEIDLVKANINTIKGILESLSIEAIVINPGVVEEKIAELKALYEGLDAHLDNLTAIAEDAKVIAELHYDRTLTELTAQIQHQLEVLDAQIKKQLETLEAQVKLQLETLDAQIKLQLETLEAQVKLQLETLNAELQVAVGEAKEAIKAEIERVTAEYEATKAALIAEYEAAKAAVIAEFEATKAALIAEYEAKKAELEAKVAEQLAVLEEKLAALDLEVADVIESVKTVIADLEVVVKELAEGSYDKLSELYANLVDAIMEAVEYYGKEASELVYNWLMNNADKVVDLLAEFGDDAAEFIADNAKVIFGVLAIVAVAYGEDLLGFVLENADIIFPAVVDWFAAYGNAMWDLIRVYLDAILAFYNISLDFNFDYDFGFDFDFDFDFGFDFDFDFDFSSLEGINKFFDKIFGLIAEIYNMIVSGNFNIDEFFAIIDEIKATIDELIVYVQGVIRDQLNAFDAYIREQLAALNAYLMDKAEELGAAIVAFVQQKLAEVADLLAAKVAEIVEAIKNSDSVSFEAIDKFIFDMFSRVDADLDTNADFVSIGGNNNVLEEDHYANLVAEALGIKAQVLHDADLRISDLRAILDATYTADEYGQEILANVDVEAYIKAIEKAEVISVEFGVEDFTTFAFAQVVGYLYESFGADLDLSAILPGFNFQLGEHKVYEMNWNNFGSLINEDMIDNLLAEVENALTVDGIPAELNVSGVTIDVVDIAKFAVESYLYAFANYVYNYGATIEAIHALNPDAEVIVLGAFNPFDGFEIALSDDVVIDVDTYAEIFVRALDVHTLAYAFAMDNTYYVYVGGVETVAEADGVVSIFDFIGIDSENNTLSFNGEALDASEAGHAYIAEQIIAALNAEVEVVPPCQHVYDDCLDATCNICGEEREITGHVFDSCEDTECNVCGFVREAQEHAFSGCTDPTCYKCPYVREAGAHTYDNCLDAECNVCGYKRVAAHTYADVCSEKCLLCDHTRVTKHTFGEWKLTKEATRKVDGEEQRVCSVCGKIETRPVAFVGLGGGAIAGIVSGSTVVAGAGGFSVFWFVVKKKSFTDLVGAVKALTKKGVQ